MKTMTAPPPGMVEWSPGRFCHPSDPRAGAQPAAPVAEPLLSGAAILGPLTEGLAPATVLSWIQSWDPPGCPATATSLDQVRQEYLAMVQSDSAAWKAQLDAYLAR